MIIFNTLAAMRHRGFCCFLNLTFYLVSTVSFGQETELEKAEEFYWSEKDSSAYYFEAAFDLTIKKKDNVSAFGILCEKVAMFSYHRDRLREKKEIDRADSLLLEIAYAKDTSFTAKYYQYYHWYNKGSYHYNLYDYRQARKSFFDIKNAIKKDTLSEEDFSSFETVANSFIASMNVDELKYDVAEEFYNRNIELHHAYGHGLESIYDTKNLIASLKAAQGEYGISNHYARESIEWMLTRDDGERFKNSLISTGILLISNYLETKKQDSAQFYIEFLKDKYPEEKSFKISLLLMESRLKIMKREYKKALGYLKEALLIGQQNKIGNEIASVFKEIGDLHYETKNYEKALDAFLKGSSYFGVGPEIAPTESKALNRIGLFPILLGLSKTYGLETTDTAWESQIAIGQLAMAELLELKTSFYDDADKQVLVENALPIFENSLEACYQKHLQTKNSAYIDTAFVFFERSKGNVLLDARHRNRASLFAGVSPDLLEREKILKISIADAAKSIQEGDSLAGASLFELRREHERLLSLLEQEHPKYFELKFDKSLAKLKDLQEALAAKQTAISYFFGDQAIYIIQVSKKERTLHKVRFSSADINHISAFKRDLGNPKSDLQVLNRTSLALYQKFLQPFLLSSEVENLVLIPDGILQTLPFGALNTDSDSTTYLIEKYGIAYANSATLWLQLDAPKKRTPNYLAMAPGFKDKVLMNNIAFAPLPNSKREVDALANYFDGTAMKDAEATAKNFREDLEKHSILHLATHARINDEFPEYSFLTFTPDTDNQGMLYINDLYAMDIDADLVTLSACDTGLGEFHKGEGAISLARAFFYSGANSIVQTSWSINDGSTPEIMDVFYGQLAQGSTKDRALQQAKLVFLEKHRENKYSHPYYWSGFLLSGNTAPMVKTWGLVWYHYLFFGLVILSIFLFRKRKKSI